MPWPIIAQLIIEVGYPMAMQIWKNAQTGGNATPEQWAELDGMTKQTARDRMLVQLKAAGVDPESDHGKALLALAK